MRMKRDPLSRDDRWRRRRTRSRRARSRRRALADAQLARVAATDADDRGVGASRSRARSRGGGSLRRAQRAGRGPLHGIGIGVKDIIATADQPTQMGSPIYAGHRPQDDAECIARLKRAGGYVFGKAVTTAFAFLDPAKTKNPWNAQHTPGGSSAGPAAAVAAGHVTGAIGTQTNGSVIRPGRVLRRRRVQADEGCDSVCRRASLQRDARPARHVHAHGRRRRAARGRVGQCRDASRRRPRRSRSRRDSRISTAFPGRKKSIATPTTRSMPRRRGCGSTAPKSSPVPFPAPWREANLVHRTIMLFEAATHLAALQDRERARMSPKLNAALDEGRAIRARRLRGRHGAARSRDRFLHRLARRIRCDHRAAGARSGAEGLDSTGDPSCCTLWSLTGFPALTLPIGLAGNGLPLGMQLASPAGDDDRLLAVAAWCEARLPFKG